MTASGTTKAACLVIDIHLGDVSGIELGRQLVLLGLTVPVIFMSGDSNHVIEGAAFELGCIAFLHKPFPCDRLLEAVESALQRTTGARPVVSDVTPRAAVATYSSPLPSSDTRSTETTRSSSAVSNTITP